jgi:hypothetical protein
MHYRENNIMFYTIYKITNKKTGQIYIGQHVTNHLVDGYMGSGVRIINSIAKYGKDQFDKEILFIFDNFEDMDQKESELVNEEFIRRTDTYNVILGGTGWCTKGTVAVEYLLTPGVFARIPADQFNPALHRYPTSDSVQVYLKTTGDKIRVSMEEYRNNKSLYTTASTGQVSVRDKTTGETLSIPLDTFNGKNYEKVLGGIVVVKDGVKQYVTKEEFVSNNMSGIHKNKVTVTDVATGIKKHITTQEYYANKDRYQPNGYRTVVVTDKLTGVRSRIPAKLVDKSHYTVGTTGWVTVYDMAEGKFLNIPRGTLDITKHKRANDKKFVCYNSDGTIRFEFWGGKQEFLERYKCPASVWEAAVKGNTFKSDREKSKDFNGCNFVLINWKT